MYEITVKTHFNAAHFLRGYDGKCANVHGHNFDVIVTAQGDQLKPNGLLMDFKDLKASIESRIYIFDHQLVNEMPPFDEVNPTVENFCKWLYETLAGDLHGTGVEIKRVEVKETEKYSAAYLP
ncbi:MAG: 6-carboxytetrahydropterin synthase QueD [Armatimonadetes bacterium]|nr:6-carboxytetrahydropterin synthase QueD [Armatimonadota bacterium]